ncbi:intracellular septation protein A [Nonomuraea fuscirosea]|uniref:Intracellular septation protein A n=1 Tax=Nonomuraea fuscirosea TaxID=1291556 RepID=A0A2T0MMF2_9ACTN|nr:VC0807 family protein [Nonomuraea fuscirosea]PRX59026.1 intracellular septation protein A [Nonomuraea fuscirosea]
MSLARQAIPRLLEAVIIPLTLFYTALAAFGLNGALAAVLTWAYGSLAWRRLLGRPMSASMILATVAITVRVALAAWSGSAIVYFLQPELGTICFSMMFLASIWLRRPLVGKLIGEYVRLPQAVMAHERIRRCFVHLTVLWALVLLANATVSIWLLLSATLGTYLLVRPIAVATISVLAFTCSVTLFLRVLRHLDLHPRSSGRPAPIRGAQEGARKVGRRSPGPWR